LRLGWFSPPFDDNRFFTLVAFHRFAIRRKAIPSQGN
jgi:hypothetical protein